MSRPFVSLRAILCARPNDFNDICKNIPFYPLSISLPPKPDALGIGCANFEKLSSENKSPPVKAKQSIYSFYFHIFN